MRIFTVGGAVRDMILGFAPRDKDYVVIGSSEKEMIEKGFIPVGKSYSVFLHPVTREEYTLADDLRSDLSRRDLTINALALDGEKVIDYFGGLKDLRNGVLRHIKEDNFFDDPVRVYRAARFKAQLPDFTIHPDTLKLMQTVSRVPSFETIVQERLFKELERALSAEHPANFFKVLYLVRALSVHFKELDDLAGEEWAHTMELLEDTSLGTADPVLRFSALFIFIDHPGELLKRLNVPVVWKEAALAVNRYEEFIKHLYSESPEHIVDMFYALDAYRKPYLVQVLTLVLKADERKLSAKFLETCFKITQGVSSRDVSEHLSGKDIGLAIREERVRRLRRAMIRFSEGTGQEVKYERQA